MAEIKYQFHITDEARASLEKAAERGLVHRVPDDVWSFCGTRWTATRVDLKHGFCEIETVVGSLTERSIAWANLLRRLAAAEIGKLSVRGRVFQAAPARFTKHSLADDPTKTRLVMGFALGAELTKNNTSPPRSRSTRASCCGVEEGMVCAETCERRRVAEACHAEAVHKAAHERGLWPETIKSLYEAGSFWRSPNPSSDARDVRRRVDDLVDALRRKRGLCEHHLVPSACEDCDPLELASGEELDRIATKYGVRRLGADTDNMVREQARMARALAEQRTTASFNSRPLEVMDLAREMTARAANVGVKVDPRETCEDLRERIEAVLSGDARGREFGAWQAEKERRAKRTQAARDIALATGQSASDVEAAIRGVERYSSLGTWSNRTNATPLTMAKIVEARDKLRRATAELRAHVPLNPYHPTNPIAEMSGDMLDEAARAYDAPTRAQSIRAENLRVGAELAKNPPAWAYPLGWTLAVSAAVEIANNRPNPEPGMVNGNPFGLWLVLMLRRYHDARLAGSTPRRATEITTGGPEWHDEPPGVVCAAYERGRGAPGGERLGRPA